ncbi:MAG: cytochrome c5 family protein [Proteobacteria bacterium]|nr:MAG: cytochrome c5 family protein [Pseudomonadota bacterium]
MEQHPQKKDPTSLVLIAVGGAVLATAVVALLLSLINTVKNNSVNDQAKAEYQQKALVKVLQPIGVVATVDKSVAPVERSGEQVYNAVCGSCHGTGLLDSPKSGSSADWTPRAAVGLDALVTSAINGKGAMPSRGGDPSITDKEIRSAIQFMTKDTGINWDTPAGDTAAKETESEAVSPEKTEAAESKGTAAEQTEAADAETTVAEKAEVKKEAAVSFEVAESEAATSEEADVVVAITEEKTVTKKAPVVTAANNEAGARTYAANCFVCHDTGAAGSPKLGDSAAWEGRIAKGLDALYDAAINGVNAMPARGGNPSLSDSDLKAAVLYMIEAAK